MGFAENDLAPDETIICQTGIHPIILWSPLSIVAYFYVLSTILMVIMVSASNEMAMPMIVWVITSLLPFGYIVLKVIKYKCTEYALTNRRVLVKTGLFSRNVVATSLGKIESVRLDQSVIGRMFDFGNLTFVGTGGQGNVLKNVRKPLVFRQKYQELLSKPESEMKAAAC